MKRNYFWKLVIILGVVLWSLQQVYFPNLRWIPPKGRPLLEEFRDRAVKKDDTFKQIFDKASELQARNPEFAYGNLKEAIGTNDISRYFPFFNADKERQPTSYILNRLQREGSGRIKLGIDLAGGTQFVMQLNTNALAVVDTKTNLTTGAIETVTNYPAASDIEGAAAQAVEVIRARIDRFGVAEPVIQPQGNDRILIQLPGLSEAVKQEAIETLQKVAFLEFRLVHPQSADLAPRNITEPGYEILTSIREDKDGKKTSEKYLVKKRPEMTGGIKNAWVERNNLGQPVISFTLDGPGTVTFRRITQQNVGRQLAIVLDGELQTAPVIETPIENGAGIIRGDYQDQEARNVANVLSNPLKVPLQVLSQYDVDPSLGHDSVRSGVVASIVAAIGTFIFMLAFYFASGIVACLALVFNIGILMAVMAMMGSTLTLPGIAGIALTIGMAVDANVLIYERMREELAAGKSIRGVVAAGYEKAFGTIFDSNLTTVIAALILIKFGSGPVQGFGVTLAVGICASMFTALYVTRFIYDILLEKGLLKNIRMLPLAKFPQIPFLKYGKFACIVSGLVIIAGIGYGFSKGKGVLGVDFKGGDDITLKFAQRIGVDQLRGTLDKSGITDTTISYQRNLVTGETLRLVVPPEQGSKAVAALQAAFPDAGLNQESLEFIGGSVSKEIQHSAFIATFWALLAILIYVSLRYEFSFAVASVIALLHDVLFTLSIYFLFGKQLTGPMLAAILTIIGYSINDKIVIMDRIREDLKLGVRGSFRDLIDLALNQTLSRTIITGGAVILSTVALLLFGGGVINDFAFTFLVGVLSGTYSSLLIAAPIVLWWHKGERPKIAASQVGVETASSASAARG